MSNHIFKHCNKAGKMTLAKICLISNWSFWSYKNSTSWSTGWMFYCAGSTLNTIENCDAKCSLTILTASSFKSPLILSIHYLTSTKVIICPFCSSSFKANANKSKMFEPRMSDHTYCFIKNNSLPLSLLSSLAFL